MPTDATITNCISLSALTDVGKVREHNEDNFIVCPDLANPNWFLVDKPIPLSSVGSLLVVADGMGGANAGEVASELAVESIKSFFSSLAVQNIPTVKQAKEYLREAILTAHEAIVAHAINNPECEGMGTTVTLAWIMPGKAVIAWCGDSRGYFYHPEEGIKIITKDHSLVWEMVEAGKLTVDEADVHPNSNIITQSLGDPDHAPKPDFIIQPLQSGDKILLCSDGLNNMVNSDGIATILSQTKPVTEINKELIEKANRNGGKDNVTVVLAEILEQAASTTTDHNPEKKSVPFFISLAGLFIVCLLWWTVSSNRVASSVSKDQKTADEKSTTLTIDGNKDKSIATTDSNTVSTKNTLYK